MKKYTLGFTIQILALTLVIALISIIVICVTGGVIFREVIVGVSIWSYLLSVVFHLIVFFKNDSPPLYVILRNKKEGEVD